MAEACVNIDKGAVERAYLIVEGEHLKAHGFGSRMDLSRWNGINWVEEGSDKKRGRLKGFKDLGGLVSLEEKKRWRLILRALVC